MNFVAIPASQVKHVWAEISPGLDNLLANYTLGRWTAPEVLENIESGEWQLFLVLDGHYIIASIVCNVMDGHKKTLELGLCWGKGVDDWSDEVSEALDQIGRELGCTQLALDGRPGWRKIMNKHGYKLNSVRYTRQLNG